MATNPSSGHNPQPQLYPVVDLFDPEELKDNYLFGIVNQIKDPATDCAPKDGFYEFHLRNAIGYVETCLNIKITPTEIIDEQHNYNIADYRNFGWINLYQWPVLEVTRLSAIYPTSSEVFEFPISWVRGKHNHGIIQIVPQSGTISQVILGQGGAFLPTIYSKLSVLPNLWHVDYITGFAPGKVPPDVKDAVMKRAAIQVLHIAGELIGGLGITNYSIGMDGLSQSTGLNKSQGNIFAFRINQYQQELEDILKKLKSYWKGIKMASL